MTSHLGEDMMIISQVWTPQNHSKNKIGAKTNKSKKRAKNHGVTFNFFPHMGKCSNNEDHHTFIYLQLKNYNSILRTKYDSMWMPSAVYRDVQWTGWGRTCTPGRTLLPHGLLASFLTSTPSLLDHVCSKNNSPEGFIPFGFRLIFLFCETLK